MTREQRRELLKMHLRDFIEAQKRFQKRDRPKFEDFNLSEWELNYIEKQLRGESPKTDIT